MHQYEDAYDDAWRYERFITTVQQKAGVSWAQAERVADREGVDPGTAAEHARAAIATLREVLPPKELSDLLAQLPRGHQEALLKIYEPAR